MSQICVLRLSALGDVTHVAAVVRSIQRHQPDAEITWVIGRTEAMLLAGMHGIEFIEFDKSSGWRALWDLKNKLKKRRFDVLLQMQVSFRSGLASTVIHASRRIGFSATRSRDLHGMFVKERIADDPESRHVLDVLLGFARHLGAPRSSPEWALPVNEAASEFARLHLPDANKTMIISPCSSHPLRDWHVGGYAAVAEHAANVHGLATLIVGGKTERERQIAREISSAAQVPVKNLAGQDTLPQLMALLDRAAVVVSPDSGPAHLANAMGTPVIGLYAATDPHRSGPYNSIDRCVNRFPEAAVKFAGAAPEALRWGTKLEYPRVMDLITQGDVCVALDRFMQGRD